MRGPSINFLWNLFGCLIRASVFADHKLVKACAALVVGLLAFCGLFLHCEALKLGASALGMILPLLYLASLLLSSPIADRLDEKLDAQRDS
jgi:hypothetical protein